MKKFIKKTIIFKLRVLAKLMLKKHKPEIIAITGNVGKTSTKEAIYLVLNSKFNVLVSKKTYNTEFGVPLTIFQENVPLNITSIFSWVKVLLKCFKKLVFQKNYYEKVILEMGADKPGDIAYLVELAPPKVGIITAIGDIPTHLLGFKNPSNILKEKSVLIRSLPSDGVAILNYDDEKVKNMSNLTKASIFTFGFDKNSDFYLDNLDFSDPRKGIRGNLHYKSQAKEITFPYLFAKQHLYPILSAFAIGIHYKIEPENIIKIISKFKPQKGRMNPIEGINNSLILDDSYNSNPVSAVAALETLNNFEGRKIAALGNMNELGLFEEEGHRKVGKKTAEVVDIIVIVGDLAKKFLADEAIKNGFDKNKIFSFSNSKKAGDFLRKNIKSKDIVLVKGSQNNVRMEWLVEKIMTKPHEAKKLLVRQGPEWKSKA